MRRAIAIGVAAVLAVAAAILFWRSAADANDPIPPAPAIAQSADGSPAADPPRADERTREEKRFGRYDKNKDSRVTREEYLASRRKAYAKLDADGDGRLSFDEWAKKTTDKFAGADADRSGELSAAEFATTRVVRKAAAKCACPPVRDGD